MPAVSPPRASRGQRKVVPFVTKSCNAKHCFLTTRCALHGISLQRRSLFAAGGFNGEQPRNAVIQALFNTSAVRTVVAQKLGTTVAATPGITVVSFKSQVVS